jgi:hypothetical protein
MALTLDKSLAGLALGMQRVELLLQSLFGGFARVDGAAQGSAGSDWRLTHGRLLPPPAVAC